MNIRLSAARQLMGAFIAIAFATIAVLKTQGGGAYLTTIGPSPLRFEEEVTRTEISILPPLVMEDNSAEHQITVAPPSITNTPVAVETESTPSAANVVVTATSPESVADQPSDNLITASGTDSAPVVTPQILAEYFKPAQNATNGAGVSVYVPAGIGFTPPKAQLSSQAIYKSE